MSETNPYEAPRSEGAVVPAPDELRLATPGQRFAGFLVDAVLATIVLVLSVYGCANTVEIDTHRTSGLGGIWVFAVGVGSFVLVQWGLLAVSGQTAGKRLAGMRIVRSDGSRAGFATVVLLRSAVNGVFCAVPYAGWLYFFIDALWMFGNDRHQALHDRLADTIVIDVRGT